MLYYYFYLFGAHVVVMHTPVGDLTEPLPRNWVR